MEHGPLGFSPFRKFLVLLLMSPLLRGKFLQIVPDQSSFDSRGSLPAWALKNRVSCSLKEARSVFLVLVLLVSDIILWPTIPASFLFCAQIPFLKTEYDLSIGFCWGRNLHFTDYSFIAFDDVNYTYFCFTYSKENLIKLCRRLGGEEMSFDISQPSYWGLTHVIT